MSGKPPIQQVRSIALLAVLLLTVAREAQGYVGPGAGFAVLSAFLAFAISFLLAIVVLATAPAWWAAGWLRRRRARKRSRCSRVIVVGLDGMAPDLAERLMREGRLPNFARLAQTGSFCTLRTTIPAISPVAWSSFQTGVNPGKHNIFDFVTPDKRTYLPDISSARVRPPERVIRLGPITVACGKPRLSLLRKSRPFWKTLGDHGVFSVVLRVPVTFPPEKFHGVLLSGMPVADLRGTQGTFTYFTTDATEIRRLTGGERIQVERVADSISAAIPGPPVLGNPTKRMAAPLRIEIEETTDRAILSVSGQRIVLRVGEFSGWVRLNFRDGWRSRVTGICRFHLVEIVPHLRLYVSPVNIDPSRPALPLSHPFVYAPCLAKVFGPYATLGLAEDTSALNSGILDERAFLESAWAIHREREQIFFDALDKVAFGAIICVFDITDRIQHMFWPNRRQDQGSLSTESRHARPIEEVYERMDEMIGDLVSRLKRDDVLFVLSDHGFSSFECGINLNGWLKQNGLLALKDGASVCDGYFRNVDWSRTKAYAVGLGGIYINQVGRHAQGIVHDGEEKEAVKRTIASGLVDLRDEKRVTRPVRRVFDAREIYRGPYVENAPDLVVGFAQGYRVSWDSAVGRFGSAVFEENDRAWSGDHCVDPELVPGVLFCNRPISRTARLPAMSSVEASSPKADPSIIDIAPTVLDLFGVPIPEYMEGESLLSGSERMRKQTGSAGGSPVFWVEDGQESTAGPAALRRFPQESVPYGF